MIQEVCGCLCGLLLEVGDEVVPVLGLLETTESHLGTWDVLLWVLKVLELKRISPSPLDRYPR